MTLRRKPIDNSGDNYKTFQVKSLNTITQATTIWVTQK
jgi:hypothetical protein